MRKTKEFYRGCLIGGAIGDAAGWPIELMTFEDIKNKYGENGLNNLVIGRKGKAEVSDDTQMTLFTAEGVLRAESRGCNKGISDVKTCIYHAYLRWLYTQNEGKNENIKYIYDGYLIKQKELYAKRAPGKVCLMSLMSGEMGTIESPINDSKSCEGVKRIAPIGLFYRPKYAFSKAMDCAAITHGHALGYLSAGALAYIISNIIIGSEIDEAVIDSISELNKYGGSILLIELLKKAVDLSKSKKNDRICINELGRGLVAEEALAIAVFSSLRYKNSFEQGIITAINHDGDSDSTGAITGNILGAYLGVNKIPKRWIYKLELVDIIGKMADDLLYGYSDDGEWWIKYPGY